MICPVCGNNSPDSLRECQFCSTPLKPAAPAAPAAPTAPQYNPGMAQYGAAQPQQMPTAPGQPYGAVQPQPGMPFQQQYGRPQQPYGMQPTASPMQQSPYGAAQPQSGMQPYGGAQMQYGAQQPYGSPVQQTQNEESSDAADTDGQSPEDEAEEIENEKKVSKGTLAALLVWFAFMAIAFAAVYFDLPGAVNKLIASALPSLSASDVNAPHDENYIDGAGSDQTESAEPVLDALHGTWVLCTYYVQDLTTNNITGGQHYTHDVPLQFFTFNAGTLDRCTGSAAAVLSHEQLKYSYTNNIYSGPLLLNGSETPSVVLGDNYMCVYDTFTINGSSCNVEYALLRVFDEPAGDDAISVYAGAIESGSVSLPQYTSSVMTSPSIATSAPAASSSQVSATYSVLGTWLLTETETTLYDASGQPIGSKINNSISDRTLDYFYAVFRLDNAYRTYTFKFSDDLTECLEENKDSGSYEFVDGLLSFAPASSRTSVAVGEGLMYMEYEVDADGGITEHHRDTYRLISTDAYSRDELIALRPEV